MVAILGGFSVFLMMLLMGAWATIAAKNERIAELEALHTPTSPPFSVIHARERADERDTCPDLPPLFDMEGNDEPTQVCRIQP